MESSEEEYRFEESGGEPRVAKATASERSERYKRLSSYSRTGSPSGSVWSTMSAMAERDEHRKRPSDQRQQSESVPPLARQKAGRSALQKREQERVGGELGAVGSSQARHVHARREREAGKLGGEGAPEDSSAPIAQVDGDIRRYLVRNDAVSTPAPRMHERGSMSSPIPVRDSEDSGSSTTTSLSSAAMSRTGTRGEL